MNDLAERINNLSPAQRALLEERLAIRAAGTKPTLARRQPGDPRVLSCAQHQLWFLDQLAPGTAAYNVPYAVRLHGTLEREALKKALNVLIGRHQVLRTMFLPYRGKVIPAVAKQWDVEFREVDLRNVPPTEREAQAQHLLEEDGARPFDLARDLKLRSTLYRLTDQSFLWLHTAHHIAWDLHSRAVFYQELETLYRGFCSSEKVVLPDLPLQYADYTLWQHKQLQEEAGERLAVYWKQQLSGASHALHLPADYSRPALQNLQGARLPLSLDPAILEAAKDLARANKVTLYMTFLAAFYVFLQGYSGQDDITVGSPFDGRRSPEIKPLIGMFINTLPLRVRLEGNPSFSELLLRVRDVVLEAISHQELPFEKIVEAVRPPRDLSRMSLFQANFRLQGAAQPSLRLTGLETESCKLVDNATAKFDLALELPSVPEGAGYIEYSTSLFSSATVRRMADDFQRLLCDLFARSDTPLDRLESVRRLNAGIGGSRA